MMVPGISLATPSVSTVDATPSQATASAIHHAFASTMADAEQKPAEAKNERVAAKDKDRKAGDDRPGIDPSATATAAPAPAPMQGAQPHTRDDAGGDRLAHAAGKTGARSPDPAGDTDEDAIDTTETPADAAQLAPVLDALKQLAAATTAGPAVAPQPAPAGAPVAPAEDGATPLPATAALLAARVVPAAAQADARPTTPAKKTTRAEAAIDRTAALDATAPALVGAPDQHAAATPDATAIAQPDAGQQLAAGGADRALDVAKQGAWLDGLARDIAATGSASSTLRFQAAPTHLGTVEVAIARGLEGASVTLTASSERARSALADARPQLIAEARAQGIHIASAQVDVSTDSRPSSSGSQPDHRHDARTQGGLSSQAGSGGGSNGDRQTRSQPFAVNQTTDSQPAAIEADEHVASATPAGGLYA
jgi:hypothetical protein